MLLWFRVPGLGSLTYSICFKRFCDLNEQWILFFDSNAYSGPAKQANFYILFLIVSQYSKKMKK